jgi:hypothetical protein
MRRPELIFLRSASAGGCNAWRQLSAERMRDHRCQNLAARTPSSTAADAIEDEVQEALAICEGDAIAALRITLIANAFLEAEIDRLSAAVSSGLSRHPSRLKRDINHVLCGGVEFTREMHTHPVAEAVLCFCVVSADDFMTLASGYSFAYSNRGMPPNQPVQRKSYVAEFSIARPQS